MTKMSNLLQFYCHVNYLYLLITVISLVSWLGIFSSSISLHQEHEENKTRQKATDHNIVSLSALSQCMSHVKGETWVACQEPNKWPFAFYSFYYKIKTRQFYSIIYLSSHAYSIYVSGNTWVDCEELMSWSLNLLLSTTFYIYFYYYPAPYKMKYITYHHILSLTFICL